jgi:hypothetical protein
LCFETVLKASIEFRFLEHNLPCAYHDIDNKDGNITERTSARS